MDIYQIEKLRDDLWVINELGADFMYVLNGKEKVLLLDTGLGLIDLPQVVRQICGEKPVIVVNTHAHMDHMSGNYRFEKVWVGCGDVQAAKHIFTAGDRQELMDYYLAGLQKTGYDLSGYTPGTSEKVFPLKEGDLIDLGGYSLRVIEVPSHTVGSVALFEERQGWLFSGDIMLMWEAWGWLKESAPLKQYYKSIDKLKKIQDRIHVIFPAHGQLQMKMAGCGLYEFSPQMIDKYCDGIQMLLEGALSAKDFMFDGTILGVSYKGEVKRSAAFPEYGGIIFDPLKI